ncbi:FtsK/SpoIIIE domain-containing protein, partial [Kitasatospora sp. NPDC049285]|uniref:FtsK/SpoIIIE domain-containing protein n=1 Tax=Kitasatospora sp. NPDC049285 TaxID=3157096 RepID=UPI003446B1E2
LPAELTTPRESDAAAARLRDLHPDPAALLLTALATGGRLWERGPDHPDALTLRLGTADLPGGPGTAPGTLLPAVPVTVDLQTAGSLGLAGPRARLAGLARAVLAQLAALHAPGGLALVLVAAAAPAEEWAWAQWLPHLRPAHGQACRLLFGLGPEQAEARLAELAGATDGPPATVVLVDGDPGTEAGREALALLLKQGPAAGVFTVCLAERPDLLPAGLGATGVITGEVSTRLTVDRPVGGVREHLADVALDAVSAAWAERLARTLAPLREAASDADPAGRGPLPEALRLLDLLRSESLSPARLAEQWAALPAGAGGAGALLGTARGAQGEESCAVDLAEDGDHLLIGGGPGSGKSELLRTLAASLAVSERPGRLSLLMVDGDRAEDGGLAGCTDLPHVTTHVNAHTDPRGALHAADLLLDELAQREALFDGLSFAEWHTRQVFEKAPALVGGPAADGPAGAVRVAAPRRSPEAAPAAEPGPVRLVVLVDDYDVLVSPGSPGGRPLARALAAVARQGARLGVHVVAATGAPEATAGSEVDEAAQLRIALRTEQPGESDLLIHLPDAAALPAGTPGRGYLRRPDGAVTAFQGARVSGRIPRTATLRPTVVALQPEDHGAAPTPRPVRELGNGPTDLALLGSALRRATES